ncbi:putative type II secretion system protein F [Stieleria varia]|uniref:Putative type II secretion system protein F n=1 Tax=Stieleria varia TaxID=2528005 RepID=A0A5C6AGP3_9BACT|nr:putative type II secretion system protein F [Stieleria varia]
MFANRIKHQTLSTLCERVGVAFDVGLDPHRVFAREAEKRGSRYSRHMQSVADHVSRGGSLADAVKAQGNYFPSNFADMIEGGERTGQLDRVLGRLADYYQQLADFRKLFVSSILWPVVQLVLAVLIVGLLIYLPSVIVPENSEASRDLLGFGLVGVSGLITYIVYVGIACLVLFALVMLGKNGHFGFAADWAARLPWIGNVFSVFPEARFVQTLSMAIESGIDAWTAVDLSFRAAGTPQFASRAEPAKESILQGKEIHDVLQNTQLFQRETIEAVQLGEESGRLAETLDKHFRHLQSQVRSSMATITYVASALIWMIIAAALMVIIFRVFSLYVDNIGSAAQGAMDRANR